MEPFQFFTVCPPGTEPWLKSELDALGITIEQPPENGGIACRGHLTDVYRVNLWSRIASRVLLRMGTFRATKFAELRRKTSEIRWRNWIEPGQPVSVRVSSQKSDLYHQSGIAERVLGGLSDALGTLPPTGTVDKHGDPEPGTALIVVRFFKDTCTISLDTSGDHLHRRGYRLASGKAPLRENLAAALIMMSGWKPGVLLVDPFCGSGTIPIEAALMHAGLAPGRNRTFAFMKFKKFDAELWEALLHETTEGEVAGEGWLAGADRDAGVIEHARENAERAGVGHLVDFEHRAVSALELPEDSRGCLVTNPPYGGRIGGKHDLRNLYAAFGNTLRERAPGWRLCFLSANRVLSGHTGFPLQAVAKVNNGGIPLTVVGCDVPGPNRRSKR